MIQTNPTKNQHFISQAEQRQNSLNPTAGKDRQRIYEFLIVDRETHSIALASAGGKKIEKNLSINDLFSFDVVANSQQRYNFEALFGRYEQDVASNSQSLLGKVRSGNDQLPVKSEVLNIFVAKFMNFVRNPYSIEKVLNTFPSLRGVKPADAGYLSDFNRILAGKKPKQAALCTLLGIDQKQYEEWLCLIFMLLSSFTSGQPNLLELVVKGIFENADTFGMIYVYSYTKETCLLSDRGFSSPLPDADAFAMDFNLSSQAFIRYVFANTEKYIPNGTPAKIVDGMKTRPKTLKVKHEEDNLEFLKTYNRNVVYQSFQSVFNSKPVCYGL